MENSFFQDGVTLPPQNSLSNGVRTSYFVCAYKNAAKAMILSIGEDSSSS